MDEPGQRQIAILGDYGQGKSSTALMFTYHLIFGSNLPLLAENSLPKRIPILVELRGKSPRDLDEFQFLATWSVKYRIDANALMRLNIAGRLILIFEGFDEMVLIGNSDFRRKHFTKLWNFCYQNAKIIITGRPNFFLDDKELIAALGITKSSNNPYCEAFKLSPFSIDRINKALRNHPDFVREQICELAKNNSHFLDLVSRPSLLHLVSILWEKEKFHENVDLLNSAYVLEKFVKHSYSRQGVKEKDSREFISLNNSERDYFMCGVASYMASKQLSNQINKEQFNDLIEKLIANIPDSISTSTSEICGEVTRPLKSRIKKRPDDLIHIQNDARTCGLLVKDLSSSGSLKFGHKSFMEYLFASVVNEYIWSRDSEKSRAIKNVTSLSLDVILDYPESVDFLAEMIDANNTMINRSEKSRSIFLANHLLRVIFDCESTISYVLKVKMSLFVLSLFSVLQNRPIDPNKSLLHQSFQILTILIAILASILALLVTIKSPVFDYFLEPKFLISFMAYTLISMLFTAYCLIINVSTRANIRKIFLWSSLCKQLRIDDKYLYQIAGTRLLKPNKKMFGYFIFTKKTK
jgi:hypothetical protein